MREETLKREHKPRARPSIGKVGRGLPSDRCTEPPSPELLAGIREFNQGLFFECHETLEALWVNETDPVRYLYQGILQVGVGFYHLSRGNYDGAVGLLQKGIELLKPFVPSCMGIDVASLLRGAERCLGVLLELGEKDMGKFDPTLNPKIALLDDNLSG